MARAVWKGPFVEGSDEKVDKYKIDPKKIPIDLVKKINNNT